MKKVILGWVSLLLLPALAVAQSYSIDWFTIAGGGGASSGGAFTLTGTIGQSHTETLRGGNYTLEGGFWPGIVVPSTTGGPTLFIQLSGDRIIISWSAGTSGYVLQETTSLFAPAWSDSPVGNPVTISPDGTTKFYRLGKP